MKKKLIAVLLIVAAALFFTGCGSAKKDPSGGEKSKTHVTKDKDADSKTTSDNGGSDSQKKDSKLKKQSEKKSDTQKKSDSDSSSGTSSGSSASGSGDSPDKATTGKAGKDDVEPGNADPTGAVAKDKTSNEMESLYVGTWKIKGILLSDGSIDGEGVSGTYEIKSNGEYTADVTYADGSTDKSSGKWSVNGDKKLVAGSAVMGLDRNSRLLKDSGERDGKGNRLYYAFVKGK